MTGRARVGPAAFARRSDEARRDALKATTIVIVSHNTRGHLEHCLEVVSNSGCAVVVVDTASTDASVELVRERYPEVQRISLQRNVGFAAAANAGIAEVHGRYVLLLNADALPLEGAVAQLAELAERRPDVAMIGPQLLNTDGSVQRSVFRAPPGPISLAVWAAAPSRVSGTYAILQRISALMRRRNATSHGPGVVHNVEGSEYLKGAALLLRREALEHVGGFDESFFMFSEEADLCYRLREAGWSVAYLPTAKMIHTGGASTRLYPGWMYRELLFSHLRLLAKYRTPADAERARRILVYAVRLRAALHRGASARRYRAAADALEAAEAFTDSANA